MSVPGACRIFFLDSSALEQPRRATLRIQASSAARDTWLWLNRPPLRIDAAGDIGASLRCGPRNLGRIDRRRSACMSTDAIDAGHLVLHPHPARGARRGSFRDAGSRRASCRKRRSGRSSSHVHGEFVDIVKGRGFMPRRRAPLQDLPRQCPQTRRLDGLDVRSWAHFVAEAVAT